MRIIDQRSALLTFQDDIIQIADKYKNEIGFWPASSIKEAILRDRLVCATKVIGDDEVAVGFLIFSGVFPNSRIQVVAISPNHLRQGIAQVLLNATISKLELQNFRAVSAKPAKDIAAAQSFYENNGFAVVRTVGGGRSRNREIVIRERLLNNRDLLTSLDKPRKIRIIDTAPAAFRLWILDINVLMEISKARRTKHALASKIFSAALSGRIRMAVTSEFLRELGRFSTEKEIDPILELAKQLPTINLPDGETTSQLSEEIHNEIFRKHKPSQAGSDQALSDSIHLAECIMGNAFAFITSDGVLLNNRPLIREKWGLEVAALDELNDALSEMPLDMGSTSTVGKDFRISNETWERAQQFFKAMNIQHDYADESHHVPLAHINPYLLKVSGENDETIGVMKVRRPQALGDAHQMILAVDHRHPLAEMAAEVLMNQTIDHFAQSGPNLLSIAAAQGQIVAYKCAQRFGFVVSEHDTLKKLTLGTPLFSANHEKISSAVRLLTGQNGILEIPGSFEELNIMFDQRPDEFEELEKTMSPALILAKNRPTIIQPIKRSFADELLGTSNQQNMLEQFGGAYLAKKTYVCSGRSKNSFRANQIVFFYESGRNNGRQAIVAIARVDDVLHSKKDEVGAAEMRHTVVESVDQFAAGSDVTLFSFSSLLRFPRPVLYSELKKIQATGNSNLQSATVVTPKNTQKILELGWL